jgi:hypothetical protein
MTAKMMTTTIMMLCNKNIIVYDHYDDYDVL